MMLYGQSSTMSTCALGLVWPSPSVKSEVIGLVTNSLLIFYSSIPASKCMPCRDLFTSLLKLDNSLYSPLSENEDPCPSTSSVWGIEELLFNSYLGQRFIEVVRGTDDRIAASAGCSTTTVLWSSWERSIAAEEFNSSRTDEVGQDSRVSVLPVMIMFSCSYYEIWLSPCSFSADAGRLLYALSFMWGLSYSISGAVSWLLYSVIFIFMVNEKTLP